MPGHGGNCHKTKTSQTQKSLGTLASNRPSPESLSNRNTLAEREYSREWPETAIPLPKGAARKWLDQKEIPVQAELTLCRSLEDKYPFR
jgi:hypothetical protein